MAWEDLHSEVEGLFIGLEVPEVAVYEDSRILRSMHHVPKRKRRPWRDMTAQQREAACQVHRRRLRPLLAAKRRRQWEERGARTWCQRPGCHNLMPLRLRPGPVPETCSHGCSNALAYYRRAGKVPKRHP